MVRRVGVQRLELRWVLDRPELRDVERAVRRQLNAQLVVDTDVRHNRFEEIRPLGQRCAHEEPAVAPALDREPPGVRVAGGDEPVADYPAAIRLAVASFCYTGIMNPERDHWPFGYETGRIAASIATGHGYANPLFSQTGPTAWMTPGYPYLLAGVFKIFGVYTTPSALVILALQGLFAALTCIPIFLIARRWFGEPAAQWSVWIWALFPYGVFLASDFVWENCLTALLLTTLVWLTLDMDRRRSLWAWAGYGLLWGLTALVNPSVLTVLPVVVLFISLQRAYIRGVMMGSVKG